MPAKKRTYAAAKARTTARKKGTKIKSASWTPKSRRGWFAAKAAAGELWQKSTASGTRSSANGTDKKATRNAKRKRKATYMEVLSSRKRKPAKKTTTRRRTTVARKRTTRRTTKRK